MSSSDSNEDDIIDYYQYRRPRRVQRNHWVHPAYMRENANSRLFIAANESPRTDRKFIAFHRMSKESYLELARMVDPILEKLNTDMREFVSAGE